MRSAPCAWTCHRANDAARDCARAGSRALHGLPSSKRCDRYRRPSRTCARAVELTRQEEAANARRWQESGRQGGLDEWSWSLNWDAVRDDVIVGSCPRSADDIVRFFRFVNPRSWRAATCWRWRCMQACMRCDRGCSSCTALLQPQHHGSVSCGSCVLMNFGSMVIPMTLCDCELAGNSEKVPGQCLGIAWQDSLRAYGGTLP